MSEEEKPKKYESIFSSLRDPAPEPPPAVPPQASPPPPPPPAVPPPSSTAQSDENRALTQRIEDLEAKLAEALNRADANLDASTQSQRAEHRAENRALIERIEGLEAKLAEALKLLRSKDPPRVHPRDVRLRDVQMRDAQMRVAERHDIQMRDARRRESLLREAQLREAQHHSSEMERKLREHFHANKMRIEELETKFHSRDRSPLATEPRAQFDAVRGQIEDLCRGLSEKSRSDLEAAITEISTRLRSLDEENPE